MADPLETLLHKRDGRALSRGQIESFLGDYVAGRVPDYQASALLMAVLWRGMEPAELAHWTRAMLASGATLDLRGLDRPVVDKHSTGGVGDKASIPLAPAVAACGAAVPMISGRGLGHTGGTLDKLESIPGFSTEVPAQLFRERLERSGLVFAGQSAEIVPADRKLYALRDVTGTVESIPLIASSILSKKLAEGLDGLVLDVKWGSGAFLPEPERGAQLARTMVDLARDCGLPAVALQTNMARPLGRAIGHTLEIEESLDCLRGEGPADLRQLVCELGAEMLLLVRLVEDLEQGRRAIAAALDDGRALGVFRATVAVQGGDVGCLDGERALPSAPGRWTFEAPRDGYVGFGDLRDLGRAVIALGGGRRRLGEAIDPTVGVVLGVEEGEHVERGRPLATVHHRGPRGLGEAQALLARALELRDLPHVPAPLIRGRIP
jgi:pyrimidine-nucleoside phosphorylase